MTYPDTMPELPPTPEYDEVDYGVDTIGEAITSRPSVEIGPEMADIVDRAELILKGTGRVYQRAGRLVRVVEAPEHVTRIERSKGSAGIAPYDVPSLLDELSRAALWLAFDGRTKKRIRVKPPHWVAEVLLSRGTWSFPALRGVITAPTIKASGELLDRPGYDAETGLMLLHSGRWPQVRQNPTHEHAKKAMEALLEVVADFPFTSDAGRAMAIAAMMSVACRPCYDGPTPLFVVAARDAGTGKTRLADAVAIIGTGCAAPMITPWSDPDEGRKTLMAMALAGDPVGLLDNWPTNRALGDEALDGALTKTDMRGRILGKSEMGTAPWHSVLMVTGNNVSYAGDTSRRALQLDLDAGQENPEERTGFKHDPLLPWVTSERKRLVVACLTVMRAYHVAGRPRYQVPVFGSFEAWSDTVRHAVIWAGLQDPCAERAELKATSDPTREALRVMLSRWERCWGDTWRSAREIVVDLVDCKSPDLVELREAIDDLLPPRKGDSMSAKMVGKMLTRNMGAVRGGLRLVRSHSQSRDGIWCFRVERVA